MHRLLRYRREELKIQAWENRERRKAELQMKMAEVRIDLPDHTPFLSNESVDGTPKRRQQEQFLESERCTSWQATAERRMVRSQEKATGKLAGAQAVAKEKRARAEAKMGRRAVRVAGGEKGLPSKLKLFSLKLPLLCS